VSHSLGFELLSNLSSMFPSLAGLFDGMFPNVMAFASAKE